MELVHPEGTTELYKHLGVDKHGEHGHDDHADSHADHESAENLPTHQDATDVLAPAEHEPLHEYDEETNTHVINISRIIRVGFPYILVFAAAVVAFLVFFTHTSFSSFFSSVLTAKPKAAITKTVIPSNQQAAYNTWIRSYFYDVSDPSVLDPDNDISGNGLTNYQKFLLGLNPKVKSTLGLDMSDSEALVAGIDPLTGNKMTDAQKQFLATNIDLEALSNKISLAAADLTPKVAGASTTAGGDNSGSTASGASGTSNTDSNSAPQRDEIIVNDNTNGELDIPSLKISVPLIWTKDTKNFDTDLTQGVVHYPGTAMPGEIGTAYISGHSSNYAWIKSKYNNIFAHLGDLKQFDSFVITVKDNNNNTVKFHYVVTGSQIFKVDDQTQFAGTGKSVVALSTCWPIGTSDKRLVVFGELTQVEK